MSQFFHRVRSKSFPPSELDGKTLRCFQREHSCEYTMRVHEPHPDGTFILLITVVSAVHHPNEQVDKIEWKDVSLDQHIVDQIERAGTSNLLRGAAFVVFDESPKAREKCRQ